MPDKKDFPKLNTQARVDFYKKNNLKMDATTELPKEKAVKTKQTPKTTIKKNILKKIRKEIRLWRVVLMQNNTTQTKLLKL